ncbi:uncharacterized protein LOC132638679 [Lycium barbarum]|uniref:uncharacterized protein LOC132638679 n=1 Tax=Lycium barbarum TaxID=112863 RepID=UPI00293E6ED6|nr:uncharacterized protein LOC132638679 [Lycium barbarum]
MARLLRFILSCSILLTILFLQAMAEKSNISRPYPRKLRTANPPFSKGRIAELLIEGENEIGEGPYISAEGPESNNNIVKMEHHHSADKSVAGGGVIIGGLVTAIFAAVYCYIRVTRKKENV